MKGKYIRNWEKKDKQIVYRCTSSMYNNIEKVCKSLGVKKSDLLRHAIEEYIKQKQ